MGKQHWIMSDSHFCHENLLTFAGRDGKTPARQFDNAMQMNECIIQGIVDMVKPGDVLWHLGDVLFGKAEQQRWFSETWPKVTGAISTRLILGNHDQGKYMCRFFDHVHAYKDWKAGRLSDDVGIGLSHKPLHEDSLYHHHRDRPPMVNVHGHIHHRPAPSGLHLVICPEHVGYRPVNMENILEKAKKAVIKYTNDK